MVFNRRRIGRTHQERSVVRLVTQNGREKGKEVISKVAVVMKNHLSKDIIPGHFTRLYFEISE